MLSKVENFGYQQLPINNKVQYKKLKTSEH